MRTENGAFQHEHAGNNALEFFSKAGSLFVKKGKQFYENSESALKLFKNVWQSGDDVVSMQLLFWLRDCRGGAGNRSGFGQCLKWLATEDPEWIASNLEYIVDHGRYSDLRVLFDTAVENDVVELWGKKISAGDHLACKWAKKDDNPLRRYLVRTKRIKTPKQFRKLLVAGRKTIVETKMCQKNYKGIEYKGVPSKAMSLYTNAFGANDAHRFNAYKSSLAKGETKINANVLFPHDCVRTGLTGDSAIANAQFKALPNYIDEEENQNILCICDSSGSMGARVAGETKAIDVAAGLSLYCSDRISKDSPFHRKFLQFATESELSDWTGMEFSDAVSSLGGFRRQGLFNGAVGSTNIQRALNTILEHALKFNATQEQIPSMLLILSDMQFNGGGVVEQGRYTVHEYNTQTGYHERKERTIPPAKEVLRKWEDAGYKIPKVVYWNLVGLAGQPARKNEFDVGLVSGFSPSILSAIFGADDFTPMGIMKKKLEKYKVNIPV